MKKLNILTHVAIASLLFIFLGCNATDNSLASNDDSNTLTETELAKQSTTSYEYASHDAAGVQLTDQDAIFSIGWSEFYNPFDEEIQQRSDAFAVAPDTTLQFRGFLGGLAGLDMGDVSLSFDGGSLELLKVELRNGGVFYNYGKRVPGNPRGMFHGDNGEVSDDIPFIAGGTYRFDATGSDAFPAVSVEITAPDERLQITSPADDSEIDTSGDLTISWQGGDASSGLMVAVVPRIDRSAFEVKHRFDGPGGHFGRGRGGHFFGHGGPPFGDDGDDEVGQGMNPHMHYRYVLDENTGSFTVPAEDFAELTSFDGLKGVLVQVMQLVTSEIQNGDANYAIQLRAGDAVHLTIAQ